MVTAEIHNGQNVKSSCGMLVYKWNSISPLKAQRSLWKRRQKCLRSMRSGMMTMKQHLPNMTRPDCCAQELTAGFIACKRLTHDQAIENLASASSGKGPCVSDPS